MRAKVRKVKNTIAALARRSKCLTVKRFGLDDFRMLEVIQQADKESWRGRVGSRCPRNIEATVEIVRMCLVSLLGPRGLAKLL